MASLRSAYDPRNAETGVFTALLAARKEYGGKKLALPGIQGVVTILAGAALLSAASETAYWLLRSAFRRWPWGWRKLERTRRRLYRWIVRPRLGHRDGRDDEAPPRDDRQPPD